ncbi:MAG: ATP-binding protein [Rhizonema sp. NSF051]|nr:ATP-binding protein [Rhizonema sp. NSF051]
MYDVKRSQQQDLYQVSSRLIIARTASAIAIAVGCLALLGWWLDLEFLKNVFSLSMVPMKANAALCFILAGVSLWLCLRKQPEEKKFLVLPSLVNLFSKACTFTISSVGLFTLCQYIFGGNLGIDQLLFHDSPTAVFTSHPGRMALNTALNFSLISRAIELLNKPKTHRSYWYAQIFALLVTVISGLVLMGYAYKVNILCSILPDTKPMALHTAVTFIVICAGILGAQTDQGLMRVITSDTYSGLLTRRLLIAAIAVPLVLGWLILQAENAGIYESSLALSLLVVVLIISFCVLIWHNATLVEGLSYERDCVKQALRAKEEKLKSFMDANLIGILFGDVQGNIQQANDEFLRMIGYTQEDLFSGINFTDITPPECLHLDIQGIAEATANGACKPYEKEYIRKDGSRVPVLVGYTLAGEKREESVAFILDLSDRKQASEALRQSEERFRLAVNNIPDAFVIYDAQLRFQFVNQTVLESIQKSNEEILGHTNEEIFPPIVYETYLPTLIKATETRSLQSIETTHHLADVNPVTTFIKYVPILDDKGEIYQILGFAENITVRKQAESALSNQQKWLEEVLNLMPTPLLFIEPGTARVKFANRAADEVAGGTFPKATSAEDYHTVYYSTDAAGKPIPNEQAPGVRVSRGEHLEGFELDWHTSVGIRSLLVSADTLPAMHSYSATCVLTFQDITNLKQVEKALSLGYKRLQLLFDTANALLSSQEPGTLIDSLFRKLSEQIGLDVYLHFLVDEQSQAIHLASYSGISSELAKEIEWLQPGEAVCATVVTERSPMAVENVQQSTDSKTEIIRSAGITAYYCYPLIAQGRMLGTLSFGSRSRVKFSQNEIGMMHAACDQIAISMERLRLIASLQEQTEQLKEANRMKDEFLAILSHELRSPLNAILGWAQLLRSRKLDDKKKAQAVETIERNAKAQTQLIEDLLDISRMIRGQLRLNVRDCDLTSIIEAAIDTVRLAAEVKKIDLKFSILDFQLNNTRYTEEIVQACQPTVGSPKSIVSGDAERLQQVIWNLLSNAIKFTPAGGRIDICLSVEECCERTEQSSSYAKITVKDTGIGISPEFLPYVFDRFRQADSSSTRSHGGLGLGLALVHHLVELHGGTVCVDSPGESKGTTFILQLPLVQESKKAAEIRQRYEKNSHQQRCPAFPGPMLDGVKVLVVDDESDTREYITTVLQQCQAEVKAVASAQEALDTLQEWNPDVLVSDIGMPEEDGYSLIRKIRRREAVYRHTLREQRSLSSPEQFKKIPAAALTAYARAEDRTRAIQEGFQMHLPKPVEPAELATVVASLAGRMNPTPYPLSAGGEGM